MGQRKERGQEQYWGRGLPPKIGSHLIILNKSGSLILTVRATFQDT